MKTFIEIPQVDVIQREFDIEAFWRWLREDPRVHAFDAGQNHSKNTFWFIVDHEETFIPNSSSALLAGD